MRKEGGAGGMLHGQRWRMGAAEPGPPKGVQASSGIPELNKAMVQFPAPSTTGRVKEVSRDEDDSSGVAAGMGMGRANGREGGRRKEEGGRGWRNVIGML